MKKFIFKIGLFIILFFFSCLPLLCLSRFVFGNQYTGDYNASLIDKVKRLKEIEDAKIILVGNSNVSFGIDSKVLEERFGMPVVNLGLHGGLGNAFHENIARLNIAEGDIVIVCHSSYSDDGRISDPALAWITLEWHKELWEILGKNDYVNMLWACPGYILKAGQLWLTRSGNRTPATSYSRTSFNEYGDVTYKPPIEKGYRFTRTSVAVPEINDTCISRLNELNRYVEEKGAVLLVAGYPIGYGEYTPPKEDYETFEKKLRESLDCDVISTFTDYFFPYDYFYNTYLHLTEKGAEARTRQLILDLERWMASGS